MAKKSKREQMVAEKKKLMAKKAGFDQKKFDKTKAQVFKTKPTGSSVLDRPGYDVTKNR